MLNVNEMPDALAQGEIDVFAAWEPVTTIALARFDDFVVIHRSLSTSYLYFSRAFAEQATEAVHQILASQVRSMAWMRQQEVNLFTASRWAKQAARELIGQEPALSEKQYASFVESDLLDISPVGAIPERDLSPGGRLYREFEFLQGLDKISGTFSWDEMRSCFDLTLLEQVLSDFRKYQLDTFEYDSYR